MNNEIKYWLEGLDELSFNKVLDYITNLQTIEQQYSAILSENAELENKITNLQKEKKQLKDGWQQEVYEENKILNRWYETQGRIDKVINKLNTLINIENKESSYDRYFGDNKY